MLCSAMALFAQTSDNREYQIKAAFLFNFTQFVEWPATSFSTAQSPMIIGILGKDPFGSYLEETISGEKVNGHPLVIQHYNSIDDIKTCHVLFINLSDAGRCEQAVTNLKKGRNILTVSETNNFMHQGGMIRFFARNNKIQLQINPEATKADNLVISSKLLRLAEIFTPKK